jgi:ABC-2 type transport system permease protein
VSAALALAGTELRRIVRDRTFLFFAVLLPVLIILLIGITVSGNTEIRVGVVRSGPGPVAQQVERALDADTALTTERLTSRADAVSALRRGQVSAVVLLSGDLEAAGAGSGKAEVEVLVPATAEASQAAVAAVASVVARQGALLQAARFATDTAGGRFDANLSTATALQGASTAAPVRTDVVDSASDYLPLGFGYSAPTMLVLFVFINAVAGGAALIQTRRLGIFDRALAAPTRPRDLVLGEAFGYLALTLGQALLIVAVGSLLFGVDWGDPQAAAALVVVWAAVGTGAGMASGTLFRTPEQAGAIGPAVGIAFGMLGGCMWPLEIVPEGVARLGHLTPHAWAVDAWVEVLSRGGGLPQVAGYLAILSLYAAALLALASLRLRRSLVTP